MVEGAPPTPAAAAAPAAPAASSESVSGSQLISLDILRVIREAQQTHGLRHGDYQRYRGYCSRRLRRLRRVLRLPQGDRRHYRRRDVTEAVLSGAGADGRALAVPLVQAERAWAYAMQLRQEANTEPRKRFRLLQRLRKASAHAAALCTLAESGRCCARTRLEAEAYCAALTGALLLELRAWPDAHRQLARAQLVYTQLAQALPHDERALYTAKVEELQPSLRYCAYNIGDESAAADLRDMRARGLLHHIDQLMEQAREAQAGELREVEWRGRRVAVRPERVRALLSGLADLEPALEAAPALADRLDLLDRALLDLKEAAAAARDDKSATAADGLLAYLTHRRLTLTVRRNDLLVRQAEQGRARPRDLARLYEIILHNYQELQALPGLEDDRDYQAALADEARAYRALRALHIARVLVGLRRWREALAMLDRAAALAAAAAPAALPADLAARLRALAGHVASCRCELHANSVLEAADDAADADREGRAPRPRGPLAERLGELCDEPSALSRAPAVCRVPPAPRPAPCKPLFFDLACNLVAPPALAAPAAPAAPAAGLSGLVKGFLGWGARQ